jgi:hypothetical protein
VRNGTVLQWRYAPARGETYEAAFVRDTQNPARVRAIAIVRKPTDTTDPRLKGIKVASLSDLLFRADDPRAGLAAVAAGERLARRMGADALLCTTSHPTIEAALKRRAYIKLPGNVHFMVRDPGNKTVLPMEASQWWMTRGDAFSDEVF